MWNWNQIIASGWDPTGSETVTELAIGRALLGMDIGIIVNKKRGHEIKLGAVVSKLLGGTSGDFSEAHLLYNIAM